MRARTLCQHGREHGYLCMHCHSVFAAPSSESADAVTTSPPPETPGGLTFAEIGAELIHRVNNPHMFGGIYRAIDIGRLAADLVTKGRAGR